RWRMRRWCSMSDRARHAATASAPDGADASGPAERQVRLPPGPRTSLLNTIVYRPGRDPLVFFTNLARTYGDIVSYRMAGERVFFINDPQYIKDVLVTHNRSFMKGRGLQRTKQILGEGLLTSEGAHHLRQRRLMQPAFHRD